MYEKIYSHVYNWFTNSKIPISILLSDYSGITKDNNINFAPTQMKLPSKVEHLQVKFAIVTNANKWKTRFVQRVICIFISFYITLRKNIWFRISKRPRIFLEARKLWMKYIAQFRIEKPLPHLRSRDAIKIGDK